MVLRKTRRNPCGMSSLWSISPLLTMLLLCSVNPLDAKERLDNDNVAGDEYSDPGLRPEIVPAPASTLPDKPEDIGQKLQPIGTNQPTLRGTADTSSINLSSKAEILPYNPLSRYRGDNIVFFKVYIKNSGPTPVLILGRDAQFVTPSATVKTIRAATLENHDNTLLTPKEKVLVGAVGIGTAGLASSIFYEHMTPTENRKRSLGIALGRDRGRHEVEAENLGTRLIMPGDETHGWVAFEDSSAVRQQNTLRVPVMFPPYSTVAATLTVPVTATGTQLSPADPPQGKTH